MAQTRTPAPTLDDIEAAESLVNGDVSAAVDEVVAILQEFLPDYYVRKNTQKRWAGVRGIPPLKSSDIQTAPQVLTDDHVGKVLVETFVDTTPEGIGGAFRNTISLTVSSVDQRIESSQQVRVNWARSEAVRAVLFPFLDGCVSAEGTRVWKSLVPTGYELLAGDWAREYSGSTARFSLIQSPAF